MPEAEPWFDTGYRYTNLRHALRAAVRIHQLLGVAHALTVWGAHDEGGTYGLAGRGDCITTLTTKRGTMNQPNTSNRAERPKRGEEPLTHIAEKGRTLCGRAPTGPGSGRMCLTCKRAWSAKHPPS